MSNDTTRLAAVDAAGEWTELTESESPNVVRIVASDLREAQQQTAFLHEESEDRAVFLDVEIHIAHDARTARREAAALRIPTVPSSIRYVGTASGLAGLVADIKAADVADGVTLITLDVASAPLERVGAGVVTWLEDRGVNFDAAAVAGVVGATPRTLAS